MKTCFVISPIRLNGSEIRASTDDVHNLLIVPAMEKYDFKVVRGDQISKPSNKDPQREVINLGYLQYARNILLNSDQADKVSLIDDIISNAKNYPKNKY